MKSANWKTGLICAVIMGVLTTFLCLIVADGIIGLNYPPARKHIGYVGAAVFWFGMIALPLIFHKWVKWRYTLMNLPLYYLLYFPIYEAFGLGHEHYFLQTGGFISFSASWGAVLVAVVFWGLQSLVYLAINVVLYAIKKRKTK